MSIRCHLIEWFNSDFSLFSKNEFPKPLKKLTILMEGWPFWKVLPLRSCLGPRHMEESGIEEATFLIKRKDH